jgi:hypothetical protein
MWKEAAIALFNVFSRYLLGGGGMKVTKIFSSDIRCTDRDLNPLSPGYEAGLLNAWNVTSKSLESDICYTTWGYSPRFRENQRNIPVTQYFTIYLFFPKNNCQVYVVLIQLRFTDIFWIWSYELVFRSTHVVLEDHCITPGYVPFVNSCCGSQRRLIPNRDTTCVRDSCRFDGRETEYKAALAQ